MDILAGQKCMARTVWPEWNWPEPPATIATVSGRNRFAAGDRDCGPVREQRLASYQNELRIEH